MKEQATDMRGRPSISLPPIAILSGGLATRLRPITETIPKSMVKVGDEPFVAHQLRMLSRQGFRKAVLLCGFLGEQIEAFVGDGSRFGIEVQYSYDGKDLKGTGGAIRKALPLLEEAFMVIYGDSWCPIDYLPPWQWFLQSGKDGLMTVFQNKGLWDSSNVEFSGGEILVYDKFSRNDRMQYIDYGVGAFRASVFSDYPDGSTFDLATVQMDLLKKKQLAGFEVKERFFEIGSHAGLKETDELMKAMALKNASTRDDA